PARVPRDHDQRVALLVAAQLVERHREASLRLALSPFRRHTLELGERPLVDRGHFAELDRETGLLEPRHGLADLANRAALQRERGRVDTRLVANVARAQPELLE